MWKTSSESGAPSSSRRRVDSVEAMIRQTRRENLISTQATNAASPQPGVAPPRAGEAPYNPAGDDA